MGRFSFIGGNMPLNNKTSANVSAWMTIEAIAPAGFALEQFSTDAGIVAETVADVQAEPTLDAHMVVGYTPNLQVVTVTLQPTSPSLPYLRQLVQKQRSDRTVLEVNLTVTLPATDRTYRFVEGVLTSSQSMPGVNRVQDPLVYQFTFRTVY